MIYVDTNVFIYAVGRPHPLRQPARDFFEEAAAARAHLTTSAEVLQELLHVYSRQGRWATLDAALRLATGVRKLWPLTPEDVLLARSLADRHPELDARDLVHLACSRRRAATELKTYDTDLAAAFASPAPE